MKILSSLFLLCLALSACSKKLVPTDTKTTTTTETTYVLKDTTIYVAGDTVRTQIIVPCPGVEIKKQVISKSGKLKATVQLKNNVLDVACESDSLQARISWLEANKSTNTRTIVTNNKVKVKTPKWAWWMLGIVIAYIGVRVLAFRFKLPVRL